MRTHPCSKRWHAGANSSLYPCRDEFVTGRDEIAAFLTRKWEKELDYRLIKVTTLSHACMFFFTGLYIFDLHVLPFFQDVVSRRRACVLKHVRAFVFKKTLERSTLVSASPPCLLPEETLFDYRATSLIRNSALLGPYSRTLHRALW